MGYEDLQELSKKNGHRVSCITDFIIQPVD
jgi:hypothetical protein